MLADLPPKGGILAALERYRLDDTAARVSPYLEYLSSTKIHDAYLPIAIFTAIHATRVTLGWAGATAARGPARRSGVTFAQDLFGYLVMAWGGGTIAAMLLGTPPVWLVNPWMWVTYVGIYTLLVQTGIAYYVPVGRSVVIQLALAVVDGFLRGKAVSAMWDAAQVSPTTRGSPLAAALLAAIATCGGGWVAQTLGLTDSNWKLGTPGVLRGGVVSTTDVWGAMLVSLAYAAVTGQLGPQSYLASAVTRGKVVDTETARTIAGMLMGALFAARVLYYPVMAWSDGMGKSRKRIEASANHADNKKQGNKSQAGKNQANEYKANANASDGNKPNGDQGEKNQSEDGSTRSASRDGTPAKRARRHKKKKAAKESA